MHIQALKFPTSFKSEADFLADLEAYGKQSGFAIMKVNANPEKKVANIVGKHSRKLRLNRNKKVGPSARKSKSTRMG